MIALLAATLGVVAGAPAFAAGEHGATPVPRIVAAPNVTQLGGRDLGEAAAAAPVDLAIVLPYRNAEALQALVAAQRDRNSPLFGRFLTQAQFRDAFAPSATSYATAMAELRRAGFAVEGSPNRTVIHARVRVANAEQFFHTRIHAVQTADGRGAYANVLPATLPASLSADVVVGLDNLVSARTATSARTSSMSNIGLIPGALFGPDNGFGPPAIALSEDYPAVHGYDGRGVNVADLIDGVVHDYDVAPFLSAFHITRTGPGTSPIQVAGGCRGTSDVDLCNDSYTATIDAEWILGVAPGVTLYTYEVPSALTDSSIVLGIGQIASDDLVSVVNISFGRCETRADNLLLAVKPLLAQAAAEGITFNAPAFGGAGVCGIPQLALPLVPADLDTVTAVGGSNAVIDNSGRQLSETALRASNGGVSLAVRTPAYQLGVSGVNPSGRNDPDLVVPSEVNSTGPSLLVNGAWVGGAVFVNNAPITGFFATVQQMYGATVRLGNAAPLLYGDLKRSGYARGYFTDITLGCIGTVNGVPLCAKPGYDISSGIGSVRSGFALAKSFGLGPIQPPASVR